MNWFIEDQILIHHVKMIKIYKLNLDFIEINQNQEK